MLYGEIIKKPAHKEKSIIPRAVKGIPSCASSYFSHNMTQAQALERWLRMRVPFRSALVQGLPLHPPCVSEAVISHLLMQRLKSGL